MVSGSFTQLLTTYGPPNCAEWVETNSLSSGLKNTEQLFYHIPFFVCPWEEKWVFLAKQQAQYKCSQNC